MTYEEWVEFRRTGVGASEVSSILWADKYKTPNEVLDGKILPLGTDWWPVNNENAYWGRKLEPIVAEEFAQRTGLVLEDRGRFSSVRHPKVPCLFATPDRIILAHTGPAGALECKVADSVFDERWGEHAPFSYIIQLQVQMSVLDLKWGAVAGLVGKSFRYYFYRRDPVFCDLMHTCVKRFWDVVEGRREDCFATMKYHRLTARARGQLRQNLDQLEIAV